MKARKQTFIAVTFLVVSIFSSVGIGAEVPAELVGECDRLLKTPGNRKAFETLHRKWLRRADSPDLAEHLRQRVRQQPEARMFLAFLYEHTAREEDALHQYNLAVAEMPGSPLPRLHRAGLHLRMHAPELAARDCRAVLGGDPAPPLADRARKLLARSLLTAGSAGEGIRLLDKLVGAGTIGRVEANDLLIETGHAERAISRANRLARNAQNDTEKARAHRMLADAQAAGHRRREAIRSYLKAYEHAGEELRRRVVARLELMLRSADDLTRLQELSSDLTHSHPLWNEFGAPAASVSADLRPEVPDLRLPDAPEPMPTPGKRQSERNRAALRAMEMSNVRRAMDIYRRGLLCAEGVTEKLRLVRNLQVIINERPDKRRLIRHFRWRHRLDPDAAFPLLALATIHRMRDNEPARRRCLVQAHRLAPDDPRVTEELARFLAEDGEFLRAQALLTRAVNRHGALRTVWLLARHHTLYGDENRGKELVHWLCSHVDKAGGPAGQIAAAASRIKQPDDALKMLEGAVQDRPRNAWLRYLLFIQRQRRIYEEMRAGKRRTMSPEDLHKAQAACLKILDNPEIPGWTDLPDRLYEIQNEMAPAGYLLPQEARPFFEAIWRRHRRLSFPTDLAGCFDRRPWHSGQLRFAALRTVLSLSRRADQQSQNRLFAELEKRGYAHPDLLAEMLNRAPGTHNAFVQKIKKKIAFHPGDPVVGVAAALAALRADRRAPGRDKAPEKVTIQEVDKLCRALSGDGHPGLATIGLWLQIRMGADPREIVPRLARLYRSLKNPHPLLFVPLFESAGIDEGGTLKELARAVAEVYPRARSAEGSQSQWRPLITAAVLVFVGQNAGVEEMARLMDAVAEDESSAETLLAGLPFRGVSMRIGRPDFPPSCLPGFSPGVTVFATDDRFAQAGAALKLLASEEAADAINTVDNRVLKVLLSARSRPETKTDELIGEIAAEGKASPAERFLVAAWQSHRTRYAAAVRTLDGIRALSLPTIVRGRVESWLIGCAVAARDQERVRAAGCSAARRLGRWPLRGNRLESIAGAMKRMGMAGEGRRLAGRASHPSNERSDSRRLKARMQRALREDRPERAGRLLAKHFRQEVIEATRSYVRNYRDHELQSALRWAEDYELEEEVLRRLNPPQGCTQAAEWELFGYVCERMGKKSRAVKAYSRAVELAPGSTFAEEHLAMLGPRDSVEDLLSRFRRDGQVQWRQVAENLIRIGREDGYEQRLKAASLAASIIPKIDGAAPGMADCVLRMLRGLRRGHYDRTTRISLVPLKPVESNTEKQKARIARNQREKDEHRKLHEERIRVFFDLCDRALALPGAAGRAFEYKLIALKELGRDTSGLVGDAAKALLAEYGHPAPRHRMHRALYVRRTREAPTALAEEYLLLHAHRGIGGATTALDDVLGKLEESGRKRAKKRLLALRTLCAGDDEEFVQAARNVILLPFGGEEKWPVWHHQRLAGVVRIHRQTDESADLTPLVLESAEALGQRRNSAGAFGQQCEPMVRWTATLQEKSGTEAAVEFAVRVAELACVGEKDPGETEREAQRRQARVRRSKMQFAAALVRREDVKLVGAAFAAHQRGPLSLTRDLSQGRVFHALGSYCGNWDFVRLTPLVKDWEEFQPCLLELGQRNHRSLLELAVLKALFRGEGPDTRKKWANQQADQIRGFNVYPRRNEKPESLLPKLQAVRPPTFGAGLLATFIQTPNHEAVYGYLGKHVDEIREGDPERQKALITAVTGLLDRLPGEAPPGMDGAAGRFQAYLHGSQESETVANARAFLESGLRRAWDGREYGSRAGELIANLAAAHPELAGRVYEHAVKEIGTTYEADSRSLRFDFDDGVAAGVIGPATRSVPSLEAVPFLTRTIREMETGADAACLSLARAVPGHFSDLVQQKAKELKRPEMPFTPRVIALSAAVREVDTIMGGEVLPGLGPALATVGSQLTPRETRALSERLASDGDTPSDCRRHALAHLLLLRRRLEAGGNPDPIAPPEPFLNFYRDLLGRRDLPAGWRLGIYRVLDRFAGGNLRAPDADKLPLLRSERAPVDWSAVRPLALQGARLTNKAGQPSRGWLLTICERLSPLPAGEQWREVATPLCDRWRREAFERTGGQDSVSRLTHARWVRMLAVHIRCGLMEPARRMLADDFVRLPAYPPTYLVLLDTEKFDLAAQLLPRHLTEMAPFPSHWYDDRDLWVLTDETRKRADEFLSALPRKDLHFWGKVFFGRFPIERHDEGRRRRRLVSQERLGEIVRDFDPTAFENPAVRENAVRMLMRTGWWPHVSDAIARSWTVREINPERRHQARREMGLYARYLGALIMENRPARAYEAARELGPLLKGAGQSEHEAVTALLSGVTDLLNSRRSNEHYRWGCPPGNVLSVMKTLENAIRGRSGAGGYGLPQYVTTLHWVAGRQGQLEPWLKDLSERTRRECTAGISRGVFDMAARSWPEEESMEFRRRLEAALRWEAEHGSNDAGNISEQLQPDQWHKYPAAQKLLQAAGRMRRHTIVETLRQENPPVEDLLQKFTEQREDGDLDAAAAFSSELVRRDPSRENYERLAEVLRQTDQGVELVEVREKMLQKFGPDRELRRELIDAACDYGFPDRVEEMWLEYCTAHPGDGTILKTMIYALRRDEHQRRACRLLTRLAENITQKAHKADVLAYRADSRRRLGEREKALDSYREAIRIEPEARSKARRLHEAAEILDDLGREEEAHAARKKALALDTARGEKLPADARGLAGALERIDKKLAKIERDVFDKREALFTRVEILRAMGRNEEALRTLARVKKTMESHPRHFSHRGQYPVTRAAVLYEMGRYAETKAIIENLLQDPDSVRSHQRAEIKNLHDRMHTELLEKEGK